MSDGNLLTSLGAVVVTGLLLLVAGCKPDAAVKNPAVIGDGTSTPARRPSPSPALPPEASGTVSGVISFQGVPPSPKTIDTSMDPACNLSGPSTLPTEQYVVKDGKLANVFLYVESGPPAAMQAGPTSLAPVVLDQVHCRYVPHVIGVMQGGTVEFRNSDVTMHNIHTMPTVVGNQPVDISQSPRGRPVVKEFDKPELMMPVRCNNHPWMNAFINVSATPFFAVSDADGRFELRGLPPGTYTIAAVHEKMGEKTLQVTVAARGTAKADFSFAQ